MTTYATGDNRADRIADLRALADFLDANPDVPVPLYTFDLGFCADGDTDEECVAEIARVAAVFGVEPSHDASGTHHRAVLTIGHLSYRASTVTQAGMDRHDAIRRLGNAAYEALGATS